ncbi:helix-turn-helix transcriptional regulator [Oceanobacillus damuensis]|uniref:helix-turn-helix transcriptional regulator n=1 Tax=Oceanobacillus damuensis TaxID=937928 RepID=UPI00082A272D|nr:DeoR family transcriptional regulator [Oceanobacillus damuensis]
MSKHTPTKEKLLNTLKKNSGATIDTIMEHFSISEIAVRKQLHELVQQGLVRKDAHKQKIGRPYYTYALTGKGHETFPDQYKNLPLELLQDLEELHGKKAVQEFLNKHTDRDKAHLKEAMETEDFDEKITELARKQNEKGYMLEVERTNAGNYEIRNFHCPVANIATCYPQMCTNEKKLFEEVFPYSEVEAHTFITKGEPMCRWTITKPEKDD